jgi:hypothetical protein
MLRAPLISRGVTFLLTDTRALACITAIYLLAGFALFHFDAALNDEGLIIHYVGTWARVDPQVVFFAQKAKPILAILYALPSLGGVAWTMMAHLVVSALALPLIAGFARRLGYRLPNFPALVIGFSPVFFLGGPAGIPNNDAVVGTVLVLFLLARGYSLSSGLVLGTLPWVRSEMAPLVPILWLHTIWIEPNRRFAVGAVLFPLAYALTGAVYHLDLLWMVHYPPASPANPDNPMWQGVPIGPAFFLGFLAAITPVAGLVACLPFGRLRPLERTLLFYMALMSVLLDVLPMFRIGNFAGSPRYQMQLLPVLALFAARALEAPWEGRRLPAAAGLAALACTLWSVTRIPELVHVVPVVTLFSVIVVLAWMQRGRFAALAATFLVLAGPALVPGTEISRKDTAGYLDPMEEWFRGHREDIHGPVYTNSQLLDAVTQLRGILPGTEIRFLIGFDHAEGIFSLTNPHNGQRQAALRLSEQSFYGRGVIASTLRPEDVPPGALFALRVDKRLDITLPPEIWKERLEILFERDGARIARLRPPPSPNAP